ncbi:MAG: N-acetylmuramoyl-L-alanine amidase [Oscillospiraceae bacterium]|nr:N-acetylmuramoyl-L-alanine amidase [Oscillospiraceae bacterium]
MRIHIGLLGAAKKIAAAALSGFLLLTVFPQAHAALGDGSMVEITAEQARTYSPNNRSNRPNPAFYPLPKGTKDRITGGRVSFRTGGVTHYFYNLASGVRVSADDIREIPRQNLRNEISRLRMSRRGSFIYVTLSMSDRVSYKVTNRSETENTIQFHFANTVSTPGNQRFDSGIFSRTVWDGSTLTLHFAKDNAFWGYTAYYEGDNLILKFRQNPGSIENARIAIEVGHGGKDRGAPGRNPELHETDINRLIARDLARELRERGATVALVGGNDTGPNQRRDRVEAWGADLLISIHCNSAVNRNAAGTEVYFFTAFNHSLAANLSRGVSRALETGNRGAKRGFFNITTSTQMRSVMVESGFMSNQGEYAKLIQRGYQRRIARSIADGIERDF